ncbi:MAG: S-layer homology domain-containing protein [Eubacteriales bacterium]|nr:S-layer homology domain-containing protein [Eubacteriales bacterium]
MKRSNYILSIVLIIAVMIGSVSAYAAGVNFSDLKQSNWAYSYITDLVGRGGISGYPDGTFKPNNNITAAEFVKIVVALSVGTKGPVGNHWASGYMQVATDLEIVPEGMLPEDVWNKPLQRQKMAVILERTAQLVNKEVAVTDSAKLESIKSGIKDYDKICEYCSEYVVQAIIRGMLTGYPDGTFGPEKTATRSEASAMIIRLIDKTQRIYPTSEKSLDELVTNKEVMVELKDVITYTYDPNAAKYEVSYSGSTSKGFLNVKDLYVLALIQGDKIVDQTGSIPTDNKGNRSAVINTDITKVDYILSYDNATGDVIVIPNPLKQ